METEKRFKHHASSNGGQAMIYCVGFIGAVVYFMQTATGFWNGVWGFVQAIFWPAVIVWKVLGLLQL